MIKKNKSFFEKILDDVKPLKKRNKRVSKHTKKIESDVFFENKYNFKNQTTKKTNLFSAEAKEYRLEKKQKEIKTKNLIENSLKFVKKIKKGNVKINKKIDLHGLSLLDAQLKFNREIEVCFNSSKRCILFITGKGIKPIDSNRTDIKLYYGKIRSQIKNWAYSPRNKEKILFFSQARPEHGGAGSYYVYLRKNITKF